MSKPHIIASPPAREKLNRRRNALAGSLCLLFLLCNGSLAASDSDLKLRQAELSGLKKRIDAIHKEISKDRELHGRESRKLRQTEQEITAHATALRELLNSIQRQTQETRRLKAEQLQAEHVLAQQQALLASQMRAQYQNGRQEKIKLVLNQGDPARVGRMLGYHDYLTRKRSQSIEQINQQAAALVELEVSLAQRLDELQTLQEIQQAQLSKLESARREREVRLAELESEISDSDKTLAQMQAEQSALKRLITAIRKQLTDIPAQFRDALPLSQAEGRLPWPLKGKLLARYGQNKHGTSLQWNGVWIAAKAGTPVRAVASGRVVYVGWLHRYGLLVITEHKDGYYSLYGHNQEARVEVGTDVKAGQIIAHAGDSGGHSQSGLYFELRKGKDPVNPLRWLAAK